MNKLEFHAVGFVVLALCLSGVCSPAFGHHLKEEFDLTAEYFETETLTGNWNGARSRLWKKGIAAEAFYFGEVFHNVAGGADSEFDYAGLLDFDLHLDLDRAFGIKHTRLLFDLLGTHGTSLSQQIGTAQAVSAIEAPESFHVFQAWVETFLFHKHFSIKAGIYSIDTEFDYKESANLFLNAAFGTGPDITETGVTGPPNYPNGALGLRLAVRANGWYAQTAITDGVPGVVGETTGTRIRLDRRDGILVAGEVGYETPVHGGMQNKVGIGGLVFHTGVPDQFRTTPVGTPVNHDGTFSLYGFFDWLLWAEENHPGQGLMGVLRVGRADDDTAHFDLTVQADLVYTGLFPGRDSDQTGLGFAWAHNASQYKAAQRSMGNRVDASEFVLEATHQFRVLPGFNLQPTVQYFHNPGSNTALSDAVYLGLHFGLIF